MFGRDKFALAMTINGENAYRHAIVPALSNSRDASLDAGALGGDLQVLEHRRVALLPVLDEQGRAIVYWNLSTYMNSSEPLVEGR